MKRLTIRNNDGTISQTLATTMEAVFYRLAEYEDTGLSPEELKVVARANQDGRLIIKPEPTEATCGACALFNRTKPGLAGGTCNTRSNRYSYSSIRKVFEGRKACKSFRPKVSGKED